MLRLENSHGNGQRPGWCCSPSRVAGPYAPTVLGVLGLRGRGIMVLMVRDLARRSRTGMQPLHGAPGDTRSEKHHDQCHGSAATQDGQHEEQNRSRDTEPKGPESCGGQLLLEVPSAEVACSNHQTRPATTMLSTRIPMSFMRKARYASAAEGSAHSRCDTSARIAWH